MRRNGRDAPTTDFRQPRPSLYGASLQCRPVSSTIPAGGKAATIHVGGQNRSPSRSPHGRTRMIVFPLRRSVGFKAATASSRVETLPMFVRSRPSRTRWTISLSWARSDSTTKSTARPSAGRASAGPTVLVDEGHLGALRRRRSRKYAAKRQGGDKHQTENAFHGARSSDWRMQDQPPAGERRNHSSKPMRPRRASPTGTSECSVTRPPQY